MPGRKTNHKKNFGAAEAFRKARRAANQHPVAVFNQKAYRIDALRTRQVEGRITEKNKKEIVALIGAASSDPLILASLPPDFGK